MRPVGGKGVDGGEGGVRDCAVWELGEGEDVASVVGEEAGEAVAVEGGVWAMMAGSEKELWVRTLTAYVGDTSV